MVGGIHLYKYIRRRHSSTWFVTTIHLTDLTVVIRLCLFFHSSFFVVSLLFHSFFTCCCPRLVSCALPLPYPVPRRCPRYYPYWYCCPSLCHDLVPRLATTITYAICVVGWWGGGMVSLSNSVTIPSYIAMPF